MDILENDLYILESDLYILECPLYINCNIKIIKL